MRKKVFYIGENKEKISNITRILGAEVEVFNSSIDILKNKHLYRGIPLLLFFYEKGNPNDDQKNISELHKSYPHSCIVLVSDSLTGEEVKTYLKSGIHDTVSGDFDNERYQQIFDFYIQHQKKVEKIFVEKKSRSVKMFHLPLWKRLFDIIVSSIALIILSPLLIIVAVSIRIESKGSIIYKSKRVGSNYNIFDFLKFRSMYSNADKRLKEFSKLNQYKEEDKQYEKMEINDESFLGDDDQVMMVSDDFVLTEEDFITMQRSKQENAFVKLEKDPRITKVGQFIRKYSIDELPQLINIFKGDMSIVGNRPLPLYEAELLTGDEYIDRFMAPSGLTGLWQVEKRGGSGEMSAEERKYLDIKYARDFSFWMDVTIIFRTFTSFIQKENV